MNKELGGLVFCADLGHVSDNSEHDGNSLLAKAADELANPLKDASDEQIASSKPNLGAENEESSMTNLFNAVESEKWDDVIMFLETGSICSWGDNAFPLFGFGEDPPPEDPKAQLKTWVVAKDWWGNVSSRSLPIHAAVARKAPLRLIRKMIELYPDSIRCKNMDGDLPLHLSFKNDSSDGVVAFLLKSYPEAVGEKNNSGRQPVDFASADASEIIQVCVSQTNKVAKKEEARLSQALELEKTRLTDILSQLKEIRGELDHLRKSNMKPSEQAVNGELSDEEAAKFNPNRKVADSKKTKADRKLRLPWTKKKLAPFENRDEIYRNVFRDKCCSKKKFLTSTSD